MKKKSVALFVLFALAATVLGSQELTLSGSNPAPVVFTQGAGNWISGSVTLTWSGTGAVDTTTDLAPVSGSNNRGKWLDAEKGGNLSFDVGQIYSVASVDDRFIVKAWGSESPVAADNVYPWHFASGPASATFQYHAYVRNEKLLKAGIYRLPITFRTRRQAFSASEMSPDAPVTTLDIDLVVSVDQSAMLSLTGPGGSFDPSDTSETVDFGDLATAEPRGFRIHVSSNFPYSLSVCSRNGGKLAHEKNKVADTVSYALQVGGNPVVLDLGAAVIADTQPANMDTAPAQYDALITPGPVVSLTSGNYSDSITVTINAR